MAWRMQVAACWLSGWLVGCGALDEDPRRLAVANDGGFGQGAQDFTHDAAVGDAGAGEGDAVTDTVRARMVHAIPNLGALRVCFDPDFVADDPATLEDETDPGPTPPTDLAISTLYGVPTDYTNLPARDSGALTFHDASAEACDSMSLAALLPLPFRGSFLDAENPLDAAELGSLGLATVLKGETPLTLLGTGFALNRNDHRAAAITAYLQEHPADVDGAKAAADKSWQQALAALGPLFTLAREMPIAPASGAFTLHLAHLVPDVEGGPTVGSDAVRLCVTEGTTERAALPVAQIPGVRFRSRARIGEDFQAGQPYRFRAFAAGAIDEEPNGCATSSVTPLAQLSVDETAFRAGRSYTLLLLGSSEPEAVCDPQGTSQGLVPGCPDRSPAQTAAQLLWVPDEGR